MALNCNFLQESTKTDETAAPQLHTPVSVSVTSHESKTAATAAIATQDIVTGSEEDTEWGNGGGGHRPLF